MSRSPIVFVQADVLTLAGFPPIDVVTDVTSILDKAVDAEYVPYAAVFQFPSDMKLPNPNTMLRNLPPIDGIVQLYDETNLRSLAQHVDVGVALLFVPTDEYSQRISQIRRDDVHHCLRTIIYRNMNNEWVTKTVTSLPCSTLITS